MTKFNVAEINLCTEIEGPGKRLTIWFQGCDILCRGCCNPDFQPLEKRHVLTLDELSDIVSDAKERFGIEGVTYSGGEPTLQKGLPQLTARLKGMGLGVISFTGKSYESVKEELSGCDLVIDGPFVESEKDGERRLVGSKNQNIICLTDRYKDELAWWTRGAIDTAVEVNFADKIFTNGDMWT
ncbi:MAG: radical SAM protein [Bacteroidales bacterium]|nr:radical SAM protein [Bacteroidales bacterium]